MKIDWKLKGFNLLKFNCNKNTVIHPETCSDMVLMEHDSTLNLKNWITSNGAYPSVRDSLSDWITQAQVNYSPYYENLSSSNSMLLGTINSIDIRLPFGTTTTDSFPIFGVFQAGSGLNVNSGVLSVGSASANFYGGIKTGYVETDTHKAVQLDGNGNAFVELPSSLEAEFKTWGWDENHLDIDNAVDLTSTFDKTIIYYPESEDNFSNFAFEDYIATISALYNTAFNRDRLYPVRTDKAGHLYAFVPWTDTLYYQYNQASVVPSLVPAAPNSSLISTAFLGADGTWKVPNYPNVFTSTTTGLVPAPGTGVSNKYLSETGWANFPSIPTYDVYKGDEAGLVPPPGESQTSEDELFLKISGEWGAPTIVVDDFDGEKHGLVPAPDSELVDKGSYYLNAEGVWAVPPYPTLFNTTNPGLVKASGSPSNKFLRDDNNWAIPFDRLSVANHSSSTNYVIQGIGTLDSTKYLRSDGTWVTPPNTVYDLVKKGEEGLVPSPDSFSIGDDSVLYYHYIDVDSGDIEWKSLKGNTGLIKIIISLIEQDSDFSTQLATIVSNAIANNNDVRNNFRTALGIQ